MPETNETMLEKTFSDLAFTALRDKAQALLDYLIGFQMLEQQEDGKRAVGIFGFEIDKKVYYAPVFFLNGEIRGLESLYSVDSDLFMPLSESWINSIINKRQVEVGKNDNGSRNERGVRVPSYVRLKTLPSSHGSVNLKMAAEKMMAGREYDGVIDLPTALREANAVPMFKQAMADCPELRESFTKFYNPIDLTEADKVIKTAAAAEKPIVIVKSVTDGAVKDLTDAQRSTIMEGGVAVIDKRPEVSKSILYTTESRRALENPTDGGLYDVVWGDGSVEPAIVLQMTDSQPKSFVLRIKDGMHCSIDPRKVFVLRQYSKAEYAAELDKASKLPSDVRPNDVAVFASYDGPGTAAFCIRQRETGLSDTVVLTPEDIYQATARNGHFSGNPIAYGQGPHAARWNRVDPNERVTSILVGGFGSKEPIYTENKLVVNDKGFRAIIVNKAKFSVENNWVEEKYEDNKPDVILAESDFGDLNTIMYQMLKTAQALKVWRTGNQLNVEDQRGVAVLNKTAALQHFMVNHGLAESDARLLVDTARQDAETFYAKYAEGFEGYPTYPTDDIDSTFGNEMNSLFPGQIPVSMKSPKTPQDNREFYMYQSPFGGGGHEGNGVSGPTSPLSQVQNAANTGQKEVFDASVMGSLLKSHSPTDMVDRFLPTIITGMDRLGRILFLTLWHYDEFEERYGENDISEMIDSLKSSFGELGDIIMFMKKRSLSGDPDSYGVGVGQSSIEGEV